MMKMPTDRIVEAGNGIYVVDMTSCLYTCQPALCVTRFITSNYSNRLSFAAWIIVQIQKQNFCGLPLMIVTVSPQIDLRQWLLGCRPCSNQSYSRHILRDDAHPGAP